MKHKLTALVALLLLPAGTIAAQETRSMLFGRVLDPQSAAVAGANVTVRNVDTGVALRYTTNSSGYYEANLLLPGSYEITVEMTGFKKLVRMGITLQVASKLDVHLVLEVGGVTETISVTAEAPLLETNAVSQGRVMENKSVMELPIMGNSAILLVKLAPGIQTGGVNNYLALHSNVGGSDYSVAGNVGGNSWTLDGSPNNGPGRRLAYLPYTDAIAEFKVETSNFDASIGQSSGAAITMISKSGTNEMHGTATWQHWQQRWHGTPFFVKQQYYNRIAAADAAGNTTLANQIRNTDKQTTGRSNNWGASAGGPVVIPKLVNGRNKLFWFFTYNAFKDVKTEDPSTFNRTVPTLNARQGNFSDMLGLTNGVTRFTIHDPTTVRRDPARPNNFLRDPFPSNTIPRNRFANPAYDFVTKLYPNPNVNLAANQDPVNNYLASQTPYNWDYKAYSNRVDYQISNRWRAFGRWSYNNFGPEDRSDWTYETARGLNLNGLVRNNKGGNIDVVWTHTPTTLWNFNVGMNQFREGNVQPKLREFKPSDLGLPAYLDQKAGDLSIIPQMAVNGYTTISPANLSTWTRTRQMTAKVEFTHIRGNHSIRAALDNRNQFRTGGGGGNTSGNFSFGQNYVRRADDTNNANDLGLGWAAFILGIPNGASVATNDTYAVLNPYYGVFVQDSWRVGRKLTLNLGLRMEYELGPTERYNRALVGFDPTLAIPLANGAQANYARSPLAELPAAQFRVVGGTNYAGEGGASRRLFKNELMWLPRLGAAYQLGDKTVIRGGYGLFYDTINVLNFGPNLFGFSRNTSTIISDNFGQSWGILPAAASPANFRSPLVDPFPVRADGTRFDAPLRAALGSSAMAGRGYSFTEFNQPHARQQRWQAGIQRQLGASMVMSAAYAGSYSDRISLARRIDVLPGQYWATGTVRNDAVANNLNQNVPNPFNIRNLSQADFPAAVWADMNTNSFFTSTTIRKHQLLRPFPQNSGGLNPTGDHGFYTRTHELYLTFDKRFSKGWNLNFSYTGMKIREADFFANEYDVEPTERTSNDGRPHRLTLTGVWELPFGRGKSVLGGAGRAVNYLVGGWQLAATYEYQPGPLLDFGNLFYYGNDVTALKNVERTWDKWFNTDGFERTSARGPNSFHSRVFPTRIDGLRRDMTSQLNANLAKNIPFTERVNMQLRLDALNVQNRSQMDQPNRDPFSSNFGRITAQTSALNRWIQVQARVTF